MPYYEDVLYESLNEPMVVGQRELSQELHLKVVFVDLDLSQ